MHWKRRGRSRGVFIFYPRRRLHRMIDEHEFEQPPAFGRSIGERMQRRVKLNVPPGRNNPQLRRFIEKVNADDELYAL